ncbi:MAG: D-aminoacylase [bacterium]
MPMLDLLIRNGQVLDGTGSPAIRVDVGIAGDSITEVGDLSSAEARSTIDAAGKMVCPGFIDAHSHSDGYILVQPTADSKICQGITTEITGNCGASAAPLIGDYRMPSTWRDKPYPGTWNTVAEYRKLVEQVRPAPNLVFLVGLNSIRAGVVGYKNRSVTVDDIRAMARQIDQALDEGARGVTSGLIYAPGLFTSQEELMELSRVAAKSGRLRAAGVAPIYTTHMRSEGKRLLEAIDETIAIAEGAGIRVQISHLKTSGRDNWGLIDRVIEKIRAARDAGVDLSADRYPYTASDTDLDVIFPAWAAEGGHQAVMDRLHDAVTRQRLRQELLETRPAEYWKAVMVGSTDHPANKQFQGNHLVDVASSLRLEPVDAALHLIETDKLKTGAFFFGMNEENMTRILAEPYVMLCTDASLRAPAGPLSTDHPHPRAYGSFTRFLRMSLDGKTVPLPEAIRKMTSLPARTFSLPDRGKIGRGSKADVVVFDPGSVRDTAWYDKPHQLSTGLDHVIVNGALTWSAGKFTGNRAGRFL